MAGFWFEEELTVSEDEYVILHVLGQWGWRGWVRVSEGLAASALLVWFPVTRALGIAFFAVISLFAFGIIRRAPRIARRKYVKERLDLHGPITCGANDEGVWALGQGFEVRFPWAHAKRWRRGAGWLWISGIEGGVVYFKEESLRKAGVYDTLVSTVGAYATEATKIKPVSEGGGVS